MNKDIKHYKPFLITGLSIIALLFLASCFLAISVTFFHHNETADQSNGSINSSDVIDLKHRKLDIPDPLITLVPEEEVEISNSKTKVFISSLDPVAGSRQADVYLIIYGDLADPVVNDYINMKDQLVEKYEDSIGIVWKDFVETSTNESGVRMGVLAHCANEQLKFWEYLQVLTTRTADDRTSVIILATELGIDKSILEECELSAGYKGMIEQSYLNAKSMQVTNGHSLFINDDYYADSLSFDQLTALIDEALE